MKMLKFALTRIIRNEYLEMYQVTKINDIVHEVLMDFKEQIVLLMGKFRR